ncbi:MAG TPA: sigma-70 family RNA polymerase sigma factor [Planctomycetaceae bacterium]|jgi:RNA polymerase sigma factor (sigma-70 family)|nr:sigma-70 family RNA polymerase sigma factor [Planctomycetaceae bacterium]
MRPSLRQRSLALARLCQFELLGAEEEQRLFRLMKQAREQSARPQRRFRTATLDRQGPAARVTNIRNQIALSNLRLVVSVAKRFASPQQSLEELVSEASLLLLRCVERFDAGRGTRFSTYATRALTHHFVRLQKRERRQGLRALSPEFLDQVQPNGGSWQSVDRLIHLEDLNRLDRQLAELPRRERKLLVGRFGLNANATPQAFAELAASHGLSKEWARVTTAGAIERLRNSLADEYPR